MKEVAEMAVKLMAAEVAAIPHARSFQKTGRLKRKRWDTPGRIV